MQLSPPQQNPWHATPLAAGQCDDLALLRETTRRGEPSNTGSRIAYDLMMLYVWLFSGMVPIPPLIQSVSNAGLRIDRTPRVAVRPDPSIHSPPPTIFFPELPRPYESICCSDSLVCQPQATSKGIASAITRAAQLAGEQIIRHSPLALGQRRTLQNVSKYDIDANASRALLTHVASFIMSSERGWNRPQVYYPRPITRYHSPSLPSYTLEGPSHTPVLVPISYPNLVEQGEDSRQDQGSVHWSSDPSGEFSRRDLTAQPPDVCLLPNSLSLSLSHPTTPDPPRPQRENRSLATLLFVSPDDSDLESEADNDDDDEDDLKSSFILTNLPSVAIHYRGASVAKSEAVDGSPMRACDQYQSSIFVESHKTVRFSAEIHIIVPIVDFSHLVADEPTGHELMAMAREHRLQKSKSKQPRRKRQLVKASTVGLRVRAKFVHRFRRRDKSASASEADVEILGFQELTPGMTWH